MNHQGQLLPCEACGGSFAFSAEEAAFYAEKGFSTPKRCAGARRAKKQGIIERYASCPFGPDGRGEAQLATMQRSPRDIASFRPRSALDFKSTGIDRDGVVTAVNTDRRYGFIEGDDGRSYFFDAREVAGDGFSGLRRGSPVRFEEAHSARGPRALAVEPV